MTEKDKIIQDQRIEIDKLNKKIEELQQIIENYRDVVQKLSGLIENNYS